MATPHIQRVRWVLLALCALLLGACGTPQPLALPTSLPTAVVNLPSVMREPPTAVPTAVPTATPLPTPVPPARLAVVGDYGSAGENEARVAALVKSWSPEAVITTGDNNYPAGEAQTIDANIGQYYHEFIAPYQGTYGEGAAVNRFFPVFGNHDLMTANGQPYLDYFTLPGNERYYAVDLGPVRLFALNSMPGGEPDGNTVDSTQAAWLQRELAASDACWNVVVMHHPPFTSGHYGPSTWMQWPYAAWGADLVLSGHHHTYERFAHDGIPYIVNGVGGGALYPIGPPIEGSQLQFQGGYGAMLLNADTTSLRFQFITVDGTVIDDQTLTGECG